MPQMIKNLSKEEPAVGKEYWKSLDDLADTPGFRSWVGREFPAGASMLEGVERRGFMKVMAASFGLAGLGMTGCRRPEHAILPYGKSPEELIPGVPNYYATSMPTVHGSIPLVVESHSGRPTKVEGNPSYLDFGGSTDVYAQASVLDLYDPDRAQGCFRKEITKTGEESSIRWKKVSSEDALSELKKWGEAGKVAILADRSFSPIRKKLAKELTGKGVIWAEHEAIDLLKPERVLGEALGQDNGLRALPKLKNASRVLSLDCDFLGNREPYGLANTRAFMSGRKTEPGKPLDTEKMNRLYSVEADLTITGGVADHRLRLESSGVSAFSSLLLAEVLKIRKSKDKKLIDHLSKLGKPAEKHSKWVKECAKDLCDKPKKSIVLAGSHLPADVQLATFAINQALGSIGETIDYLPTSPSTSTPLSELLTSIQDGKVESLIIIGGNPAYTTSSSADWAQILEKVKNTARVGHSLDDTSNVCDLHIGQSHYLESWDLGTTWDEKATVPVQPLLAPLFDTKSDLECLQALLGSEQDAHALVKSGHGEYKGENTESFDDFLRLGVHENSRAVAISNDGIDPGSALLELEQKPFHSSIGDLEVLLVPDFHSWDGRYANNGWMQECPNPITKLTWDNALLISPVLAKELDQKHPKLELLPSPTTLNKLGTVAPDTAVFDAGKQKAPVVRLDLPDGKSVEGPLYVQPGLADYSVVASIGMGRSRIGRVGDGAGYDATALLDIDGGRIISGAKVTCEPTGDYETLANVQEHWSMEGRAIIREANADEYEHDKSFAQHMGAESHSPPVWGKDKDANARFKTQTTPRGNSAYEHPDHTFENSETFGRHQWGMSIDLSQCTGCSACVVACQSENNIPVVGKDQVLRGREMHWIRLDRYYSSTKRDGADIPSDVQVNFQGVACMHCETAPCESVCPVNATVHDEEGLNAMAYNRCVGTRYCANNCPYKVRRFNFFDWNKRQTDQLYQGPLGDKNDPLPAMGKNPDVTVRMRGVMEKCTYCVQRIQETKIRVKVNAQRAAKLSGKDGTDIELGDDELKVPDGSVVPACQQVCPSDAVAFGDLSDPNTRVSKLKEDPRNYSVLGYLDTRPRTTFLAKVRNPNTKMPDFAEKPHSAREYDDKAHPVHHDEGDGEGKVKSSSVKK
jgi:MoCo/4Fe-4S cofactor protein with predicted Tat translocation signal